MQGALAYEVVTGPSSDFQAMCGVRVNLGET